MSFSYFNVKKLRRQSKQQDAAPSAMAPPSAAPEPAASTPSEEPATSPIFDEEDHRFLQRLAAIAQEPESTPPPLPTRAVEVVDNQDTKVGDDAHEAILDGADKVPLPTSPPAVAVEAAQEGKAQDGPSGRRKSVMSSYFSLAQSKFKRATDKGKEKEPQEKKQEKVSRKDKQKLADDLHAAAVAAKPGEETEAAKERQDIAKLLDHLNLATVNNRVFSFSKESEELFAKFKLVLNDIVNGVPTAYDDLEKLFTEYDKTLKSMYGGLPPFLQSLIKSLPAKMTATLGPELMAAQSGKPGFDAKQHTAGPSKIKIPKVPSLKSLLSAEGAVATMLRSILNFLKLRFPAVLTGTNVVMSLAVCSKSFD